MKRISIILMCLVPILYMGCSGEEHEQVKKSAPEEPEYPMFDDDDEANKPLDSRLFYFVDGEGNEIATNTLHCPYTQGESEYLMFGGTADEVTLSGMMPAWGTATVDQANKRLIATASESNPEGGTSSIVEITLKASKGTGDDKKTVDVKMYFARRPGPEVPATLSLSPSSVTLEYRINSTANVTLTSNKTIFEAAIPDNDQSWLTYSISGNTLTFKALSKNPSMANSRSSTVTVTAGVNLTMSVDIVVTQEPSEPPTIEPGEFYYVNDEPIGFIWRIVTASGKAQGVWLVSLKNYASLQWAISTSVDLTGATSNGDGDGPGNTALIMAKHNDGNPDNVYPATAKCAGLGDGWFLPVTSELAELRSAIDDQGLQIDPQAITDGIIDDWMEGYHWVSREHATNSANAQYYRYRGSATSASSATSKTSERPVRCMRIMPLPPTP